MTATANSEVMPESGQNYQQQQQSYRQPSHCGATATPRERKVSIQVRGGRLRVGIRRENIILGENHILSGGLEHPDWQILNEN